MAKIAGLEPEAFPVWRKIAETIAIGNVTALTLSGINLDIRKSYKLFYSLKNVNPAGATAIYLTINNDIVDANYFRTEIAKVAGGAITGGYTNDPIIGWPQLTNDCEVGEMTIIFDVDGKPRFLQSTNAWVGASLVLEFKTLLYNIAGSITEIRVSTPLSPNALGAGSRLALYAMEG
jgi:hypothetical protein